MAGQVIAIPTDTLYGLAALPGVSGAVDAIFELKKRSRTRFLPVLGASVDDLQDVVLFERDAEKLARAFWPGALTIVLPRAAGFDHDLGGGTSSTIAVRVPRLDVTRELLKLTGPLAVTSANPSDEAPATTAAEVTRYFGPSLPVLDGGPTAGEPSTTVVLDGGIKVLRAGAIGEEELRQSLMS